MFLYASRIVPLFLASVIIFFQACRLPGDPPEADPRFKAFFLDVGQGDACLLRTPGGKYSLYDVGNRPWVLADFLTKAGVDTLESVFISHPDLDHFGSFSSLVREFPVKKVFLPNASNADSAWQLLLRDLDVLETERDTLFSGDTLLWDHDVHVKVLWPDKHFSGSNNDLSQVLRVEYDGHAVLLTGDIETEAEQGILKSRFNLKADILKVAHHGSRSSSGLPFLSEIAPRWAVISCDSMVYGHPHPETLQGLKQVMGMDNHILRTDRDGTVEFEMDGSGVRRGSAQP